jgi:hypothetical protein
MKNAAVKFDVTKNNKAAILAGVLFALLSAILGVILSYYFINPSKNLSYVVDEYHKRQSTISINPRVKILFDNNEVTNIVVAEVGIWNSGSQTIDENDILSLTIKLTQEIKILSADQIISSRKNLRFQSRLVKNENNLDVVSLNILNDALETSDGGVIQIIYSGEINTDFILEGRIKGIQNEFIKDDWEVVNTKEAGWRHGIVGIVGGLFLFAIILYGIIKLFRELLISGSWMEKIIGIFCLLVFFFLIYGSVFIFNSGYQSVKAIYYLSWLAH